MFTNCKYPLVAFIAALVFTIAGTLLRSFGVPGASLMISTMLMAQGIAIIWMIVLLIRKR
ncbi:MAG TPA: hypothetical protein VGE26_01875 [Sphingobacteriaceae bacterium]